MKQLAAASIILLLITTLAACQPTPAVTDVAPSPTLTPVPTFTATPSPTPTLTPAPTATSIPPLPEQIGPDSYPTDVNPLTGLTVDDPSVLQRRPLLIKISNAPPIVRPQSGTNSADVLFEHYAEGGWTRFSGLFYGQDAGHIGPVRSARLIDLELAPSFDALFAFSGASNGVIDTIRANDILYPHNAISPQFGYGEPYFVRFLKPGLPIEHTMFTTTEILREWATLKAIREEPAFSSGWAFNAAPPPGGAPASSIHINYWQTEVDWQYAPLSGQYLRWTDGIPHTDATTGEQLAFENVIVISAYHSLIELFPEKYAGEETSWYIDLYDFGPATLLRDGQSYPGRWVRAEERDMLQFLGIDSQPLLLKPGRTFVQVISRPGGPYLRTGPEELILEP